MLQLLAADTLQREICLLLRMGRGVLNRYKKLAVQCGYGFSELAKKEDRQLILFLQSPPPAVQEDPRKEALDVLLPDLP